MTKSFITKLPAKKSLGQNFLVNQGIADLIIEAGEISKEDTVIEVGPGKGILTSRLAKKALRVIAIEKDRRLIQELQQEFPSTEVIEADILEFIPPGDLGHYKIIANLPYYITSHFLKIILTEWPPFKKAVLMVQKEVAERMMAQPPHMNLLALSVQAYAEVKIIKKVAAGSFSPAPKVDSAIITLTPKPGIKREETEAALSVAHTAFQKKRKKLSTIFTTLDILREERPENLSLKQWLELAQKLGS